MLRNKVLLCTLITCVSVAPAQEPASTAPHPCEKLIPADGLFITKIEDKRFSVFDSYKDWVINTSYEDSRKQKGLTGAFKYVESGVEGTLDVNYSSEDWNKYQSHTNKGTARLYTKDELYYMYLRSPDAEAMKTYIKCLHDNPANGSRNLNLVYREEESNPSTAVFAISFNSGVSDAKCSVTLETSNLKFQNPSFKSLQLGEGESRRVVFNRDPFDYSVLVADSENCSDDSFQIEPQRRESPNDYSYTLNVVVNTASGPVSQEFYRNAVKIELYDQEVGGVELLGDDQKEVRKSKTFGGSDVVLLDNQTYSRITPQSVKRAVVTIDGDGHYLSEKDEGLATGSPMVRSGKITLVKTPKGGAESVKFNLGEFTITAKADGHSGGAKSKSWGSGIVEYKTEVDLRPYM